MSFSEILAERRAGRLPPPPFAQLFGIDEVDAEAGRFSACMPATAWHSSPAGTIYGGVLGYLADVVLTGAISSILDRDEIAAPLDLKVQFLRPVWPDGRALRASGHVVHRGRSFAVIEGEIRNEDDKIVALATSSAAIRSGGSWRSFVVADEARSPFAGRPTDST